MANATKQSLSLHPLAAAALNAVVPQEPGEKSCVPPLKLSKLQRKLAACRGDTEAFVHLCIVSIQLRQRHLTVAAEQFFQLALIGLNEHEAREALASDAPRSLRPQEHGARRRRIAQRQAVVQHQARPGQGDRILADLGLGHRLREGRLRSLRFSTSRLRLGRATPAGR